MMAQRIIRNLALSLIVVLIVMIATLLTCHLVVVENTRTKTYDSIDSVSNAEVGLLLGTTPQTRISGRKNIFFKNRIDATEELYKAHKIKYVLISGDENSLDGVNEPQCMKDSLVGRGIPADVIFLDGKGFRTLDSVVRMNKVFGVRTFTIISQRFHNERALYLSEHMGLDVENLQAYNAKEPTSIMSIMTYIREYFARVRMFIDIWTDKQPSNLEDEVPLGTQIRYARLLSGHFWRDINCVDAHNEQDTIIGNFTGKGVDTLYVECRDNPKYNSQDDVSEMEQKSIYYLVSSNKKIPEIELYGCDLASPKLVNEGDLDGNGTSEVGYLPTWTTSQWRTYRIFTLLNNEWRYLINGDYLETSEYFRHSGVEIAEPGRQKGTILVHYFFEGYDEEKGQRIAEMRDTIVKPTFSVIED